MRPRVKQNRDNHACGLRFYSQLEAGQKAHLRRGAYLLRTNCEETDPATLWRWYIQLIAAEAAFRILKRRSRIDSARQASVFTAPALVHFAARVHVSVRPSSEMPLCVKNLKRLTLALRPTQLDNRETR